MFNTTVDASELREQKTTTVPLRGILQKNKPLKIFLMKNQVITVNNKEIQIINTGEDKLVAIRPICDALGVDYSRQLKKIKEDEILSLVMGDTPTTGADGKTYKMVCLPLRYVFGWLFNINPNNVGESVKPELITYKKQCYDALFDTFTKRSNVLKEKAEILLEAERLEKELEETETYKKLKALKSSMQVVNKKLTALDNSGINEQLDLFKK